MSSPLFSRPGPGTIPSPLESRSETTHVHHDGRRTRFSLSKWYLDCVSDRGDVFIAYAALLGWGPLSVRYSSTLRHRDGEGTIEEASVRESSQPAMEGSTLRWSSRRLSASGIWEALEPPIERMLLQSSLGVVDWRCVQPRATADVSAGRWPRIQGLGYAEHLHLSLPPWRLPIRELRWGRFLSSDDSVIWIDWRGPFPLSIVFHNGVPMERAVVTDSEILLNGRQERLALDSCTVLKRGPVVRTWLSLGRSMPKALAGRAADVEECKWRSRGILEKQGRVAGRGWVIHEIVRFRRGVRPSEPATTGQVPR